MLPATVIALHNTVGSNARDCPRLSMYVCAGHAGLLIEAVERRA
jgi:hypothetical protein